MITVLVLGLDDVDVNELKTLKVKIQQSIDSKFQTRGLNNVTICFLNDRLGQSDEGVKKTVCLVYGVHACWQEVANGINNTLKDFLVQSHTLWGVLAVHVFPFNGAQDIFALSAH